MMYNMMGWDGGMMGFGWGFGSLLWWLVAIGLVMIVWLWVIKLWREVMQGKKK